MARWRGRSCSGGGADRFEAVDEVAAGALEADGGGVLLERGEQVARLDHEAPSRVDGGVDGLFLGHEFDMASPSMDVISLTAGSLLGCRGYFVTTAFGTEGREHSVRHHDVLQRMAELPVQLICYGGLQEPQIHPDYALCRPYFSRYVCTNDFRPGLREIVRDHAHLQFEQVLFIDDVNTVAEEAKRLGCPFIGVPARNAWGWQYLDMQLTGVRFLVDGVKDIGLPMLQQLDRDVRSSFIEVAHAAL